MKTRCFILAGLLLVVLAMAMSAAAQDTPETCNIDDVLNTEYQGMVQRDWLQSVIVTLNANIDDSDTVNFLGTSRELRRVLARLDANCRGLSFSSEVDGLQPVIGPISFPNGVWMATLTAPKYGTVEVETLSGKCGDLSSYIFILDPGEGAEGAEQVFKTSDGCEALLTIDGAREGWTLTFELVKAADE